MEFDYSQNFHVSCLNINIQFYKRLLWLYCFNVHIFSDDTSFMLCYMESEGKKNANSIVSFIFDCLEKKFKLFPNVKNVVFLSDAARGQNRNLTVNKFCSWFAKTRDVDIIQVFPVSGHFFRNVIATLTSFENTSTRKKYY